jgi:hypothetical protein
MRLRVPAFRRNKRKKGGVCNSISGERGDVAPFPDPLYADGTAPKNPLMLH